jgi:hypothetical protein
VLPLRLPPRDRRLQLHRRRAKRHEKYADHTSSIEKTLDGDGRGQNIRRRSSQRPDGFSTRREPRRESERRVSEMEGGGTSRAAKQAAKPKQPAV